jgi:CheY-like chemotaxis protein
MPKIMLVEDEKILRELMSEELIKWGYQIETAIDGGEGLEKIRQFSPDLILLDLVMPVKNGYAVLVELRRDPLFKNIPIIVISNSGQIDDLNRAYDLGANDVLIKAEFNPEQVAQKVKGWLIKAQNYLS